MKKHEFKGDIKAIIELNKCLLEGKIFKVKNDCYYIETIEFKEEGRLINIKVLWRKLILI